MQNLSHSSHGAYCKLPWPIRRAKLLIHPCFSINTTPIILETESYSRQKKSPTYQHHQMNDLSLRLHAMLISYSHWSLSPTNTTFSDNELVRSSMVWLFTRITEVGGKTTTLNQAADLQKKWQKHGVTRIRFCFGHPMQVEDQRGYYHDCPSSINNASSSSLRRSSSCILCWIRKKKRGKRFSVKAAKYITLNEVEYRPKWFWWEWYSHFKLITVTEKK